VGDRVEGVFSEKEPKRWSLGDGGGKRESELHKSTIARILGESVSVGLGRTQELKAEPKSPCSIRAFGMTDVNWSLIFVSPLMLRVK
jgi:hypothetical protein